MRDKFLVLTCAAALMAVRAAVGAESLEDGFVTPPDSAKPHTWYHMMNGNVTKAGITRDFEALAEAGFGGVQMFDAGCNIPPGGLDFNSPEWFDMFKHAAAEARRLGLEICIPNCSGWSSSGGPWNPPSNAMKRVVFTETRVKGPSRFVGKLPREQNDNGFYEDIAVLALPVPAAETPDDSAPVETIETSLALPADAVKRLSDGQQGPVFTMQRNDEARNVVTFRYAAARSASGIEFLIKGGDPWSEHCRVKVEASADGQAFAEVADMDFALALSGARDTTMRSLPFAKPRTFKALRVRFLFEPGSRRSNEFKVGELKAVNRRRISGLAAKTFAVRQPVTPDRVPALPGQVVAKASVRDVTAQTDANGTLAWDVPDGEWTVLRIGFICNGRKNHPASDHGVGLEVDKLSAAAMDHHFEQYVARLCRTLGPLAGKVKSGFNNILVDSYEVGSQNWTQGLENEFRRRRGYDLLPYLPTFAGHVVGSVEESERFLEDFRRVVADMFAENYAGALTAKCHQYGLLCSIEPYGSCPADNLQYGQYVDIPMGEFWSNAANPYHPGDGNSKFVSYIAHVWGKPICGTESFTANPGPRAGRWMTTPFGIKAQGDLAFSDGVNRFIYHRFTHQPWPDDKYLPGMTMGRWGMHLDRTQTWWPLAKPFFRYQARCQYLLQRGTFVADALFFEGEEAPNQGGNTDGGAKAGPFKFRLPDGYDSDICPTDAMYALKVEDGEVVVPGGVRYRMLVIPPVEAMTPKMIRRIAELQRAGAKVVWTSKPVRAPGLSQGAAGDAEVRRTADEIFSAGVLAVSPEEALGRLGIAPQIRWNEKELPEGVSKVNWIHRREDGAEWFFVALPTRTPHDLELSFRVSGREPELWDAESGEIRPAAVWRAEGGRTVVRVPFDVCGSKFVMFRKPATADHVTSLAVKARSFPQVEKAASGDLVFVSAAYGADDRTKDISDRLNRLAAAGCVEVTVNNRLAGGDPAPMTVKELKATYVYKGLTNAVTLAEGALLAVPPSRCGLVPPTPLEVTRAADGQLAVWAWQPLEATLTDAAGVTRRVSAEVPAPMTVEGPWNVSFPSGFLPNALAKGADEQVRFDELDAWNERPEEGVRYFSGRATYRKSVKLGDEMLRAVGKGGRIVLDLGNVRELAQVTANGKAFDALWRPPFRLDVTEAVKGDRLDLEITVANLWANRLIGDDRQFAPDCEWKGEVVRGVKEIGIREIPAWVKDGKPSPTGRHTFTTWKHWDKDDELLPSGLLGPVRLRTVVRCQSVCP